MSTANSKGIYLTTVGPNMVRLAAAKVAAVALQIEDGENGDK